MKLNRTELKTLVAKLIAALGLSEISYLTTKFISTYILLADIDRFDILSNLHFYNHSCMGGLSTNCNYNA